MFILSFKPALVYQKNHLAGLKSLQPITCICSIKTIKTLCSICTKWKKKKSSFGLLMYRIRFEIFWVIWVKDHFRFVPWFDSLRFFFHPNVAQRLEHWSAVHKTSECQVWPKDVLIHILTWFKREEPILLTNRLIRWSKHRPAKRNENVKEWEAGISVMTERIHWFNLRPAECKWTSVVIQDSLI